MSLYSIETRGELEHSLTQEWLLTNGLGGFASSTIVGCNTRRYHGLLCAATLPPVGRMMMLNRIGEIVHLDGKPEPTLEFSVNQFDGNFHPRGYQYLRRFELNDVARFEYDVDGARIVKEVQAAWMRNIVGIRYTIDPGAHGQVDLTLLPFVSIRDFHACQRGQRTYQVSVEDRALAVGHDKHTLHLVADAGTFVAHPDWWHGHTYAIERERGLDYLEDLFTPARLTIRVTQPTTVTLWASVEPIASLDWDGELQRRREMIAAACADRENVQPPAGGVAPVECGEPSDAIRKLTRAANDFIVYRKTPDGQDGTSILAGYPWFADWGRDTMIALPGLLLATRRFHQARQVLGVFASYVSEGMIPNLFDDYSNEPHYNTVDASLWFIHAAHEYVRQSSDYHTFETLLLPACRAIVDGYRGGTRYGIKMDEADGLITQGDANTQLTWMDAKCEGIAFTPRQGKAVEINALWYNALRLMKQDALADTVKESFGKVFWISPWRGLADVVDGDRRDTSIRPNQIFAASLPHSPLDEDQQRAVVEVVRRELLVPVGLRTLPKSDARYHGRYTGSPRQRDEAYHNGTAWAWPIGAFLEAYLRVNGHSADSVVQARQWLQPLIDHLNEACIGQISEVFEADEPHRPVGCCAQAWSVAEALRLALILKM